MLCITHVIRLGKMEFDEFMKFADILREGSDEASALCLFFAILVRIDRVYHVSMIEGFAEFVIRLREGGFV